MPRSFDTDSLDGFNMHKCSSESVVDMDNYCLECTVAVITDVEKCFHYNCDNFYEPIGFSYNHKLETIRESEVLKLRSGTVIERWYNAVSQVRLLGLVLQLYQAVSSGMDPDDWLSQVLNQHFTFT